MFQGHSTELSVDSYTLALLSHAVLLKHTVSCYGKWEEGGNHAKDGPSSRVLFGVALKRGYFEVSLEKYVPNVGTACTVQLCSQRRYNLLHSNTNVGSYDILFCICKLLGN